MLGTGLQLLYSKLGGPSTEEWKDLYGTYGEQGPDREWYEGLKDPEIYKDVGRFSANTIKDLVQFFPDIAADVGQAGISRLAQTELYNPLSEEGKKREIDRMGFLPHIPGVDMPDLLEPEWKYSLDANLTDWLEEKFGTDVPTIMKDNPFENAVHNEEGQVITYNNPSYKKIEKQADKELDDYYFDEKDGIFTKKKAEEIDKMTDKAFPWADWAAENYNINPKEYNKEWKEEWGNQFAIRYGSEMDDFYLKSIDGQLLGKYNIGGGKTSPLREFDFGFDYAWQGKPLFDYDPRRAETFTGAHGVSDIIGGFAYKPAIKTASRLARKFKPSKRADEGIMGVERIADSDKYRSAEDWMKRHGGWRGSGR